MKTAMRTLNLTYITLFVAAFLLMQPAFAAIDEASLAGLWLFDEGAGTTVGDNSGNGYDGTIVGDAQWVAGNSR